MSEVQTTSPELVGDQEDLRNRKFIGYSVNYTHDFSNGRVLHIAGTLPLEAPLKAFNAELDKLRLALSRQSAAVIKRDREALLAAKRKQLVVIEAARDAYQAQMKEAMKSVENDPRAKHNSGQLRTAINQQLETLRQQALNDRMAKEQELTQTRSDIVMCEAIIESCDKEIAAITALEE